MLCCSTCLNIVLKNTHSSSAALHRLTSVVQSLPTYPPESCFCTSCLGTSGSKTVMAKCLHDVLQRSSPPTQSSIKPPNRHLDYNHHFNCNHHSYFQCFNLDNPVSKLACDCVIHTPSSIIIANGSIFSTCYIDHNPCFDDPFNEPACHFATCTQVQLLSLTSQFPQQFALFITTNKDTRAIDNLSPTSLVPAPRKPSLLSQLLFLHQPPLPSQQPLQSQLPLLSDAATSTIPAVGSYPSVVQPAITHATLVPTLMTHTPGRITVQPHIYKHTFLAHKLLNPEYYHPFPNG